MGVIERSQDGLEWQALSFRLILAIVPWIAALEDSNEKPGSSKESIECHRANDDLTLPPLIDNTKEKDRQTKLEDNGCQDIETEDAYDQLGVWLEM